jgi:MFS family permease
LKNRLFYGWVVVVTFLIIGAIIMGTRFSFGVFFSSLESEFNLTRAAISGIFSIYMVLSSVFAILSGWALDRYGPRILIFLMGLFTGLSLLLTSQTSSLWQLFLTYSLLLSIGSGGLHVMIISTVSRWFNKKRGLALGVASSGIGLGQVIMAPIATMLISSFNWRMAYIVIGLITWVFVVPMSRLLKKDPSEIGALPDGVNLRLEDIERKRKGVQLICFPLLKVLKTKSFWLLISIWLLWSSNSFLVSTHIVPRAIDMGISAEKAAIILSLMGGMSIIGRILLGRVSDIIGRKTIAIMCSLLQAGAMVWLVWSRNLWMLYLFASIYGFAYGGFAPSTTALVSDTFGVSNIGSVFGVLNIGWGIGAAIGPAIGGLIFDVRNSYSIAFFLGAVIMVLVTFLVVLIRREMSGNNGAVEQEVLYNNV